MLRREPSSIELGMNDLMDYFAFHKNRSGGSAEKKSKESQQVTSASKLPSIINNQRKILSTKNRAEEVQRRIGYDPTPISSDAGTNLNQDSL